MLADSLALHGTLTVSPMFILFAGGGAARCSALTQTQQRDMQMHMHIDIEKHTEHRQ